MKRPHLLPAALPPLAIAVSLAACAAQERAPHGATAFARQIEIVDDLGTKAPGTVPLGVDPGFWRVFAYEEDTPDQVALGRRLFFDPRLSADGTVACATCHDSTRSFTDLRPVSEGIRGQLGRRNAPTVMNAAMIEPLFWDGRSPTLAHQAGQPVLNPVEMGMPDRDSVIEKLRGLEDYAETFEQVYQREINYDDLERSLAAFQRTLIFLDAPFDAFFRGDSNAISEDAAKGWELFNGKARCATCHPINGTNPLGTDYRFHNIGVSAHDQDFEGLAAQALKTLEKDSSEQELDRLALSTDMSELGRFMVTRQQSDVGGFRTSQLRNIGITPPYMHDGSMQTLWDTIDHYNKGGEVNSWLDGGVEALALTEEEIDQVVAFLFTLTDHRFADQNAAQMKKQRAHAAENRPFRDKARAMREILIFEERVPTGGQR